MMSPAQIVSVLVDSLIIANVWQSRSIEVVSQIPAQLSGAMISCAPARPMINNGAAIIIKAYVKNNFMTEASFFDNEW
jgi:hypothetical protein